MNLYALYILILSEVLYKESVELNLYLRHACIILNMLDLYMYGYNQIKFYYLVFVIIFKINTQRELEVDYVHIKQVTSTVTLHALYAGGKVSNYDGHVHERRNFLSDQLRWHCTQSTGFRVHRIYNCICIMGIAVMQVAVD